MAAFIRMRDRMGGTQSSQVCVPVQVCIREH